MNPVIAMLAGLSLLSWAGVGVTQPGGAAGGQAAIVPPAGSFTVLRYMAPVPAS